MQHLIGNGSGEELTALKYPHAMFFRQRTSAATGRNVICSPVLSICKASPGGEIELFSQRFGIAIWPALPVTRRVLIGSIWRATHQASTADEARLDAAVRQYIRFTKEQPQTEFDPAQFGFEFSIGKIQLPARQLDAMSGHKLTNAA